MYRRVQKKLEIGVNTKRIAKDWDTLDIIKGDDIDIVADIREKLPIEDDTYDLVYMSHVLEHIEWYKIKDVFHEIFRIIRKDGFVEIFVPDIDKIIYAYQNEIIPDDWYKYNEQKDPFVWFIGRIYTYGEKESDFHKSAFNYSYLKKCLEEAGFRDIKKIYKTRGYNHGYINLGARARK